MIRYVDGDIFDTTMEGLVNPTNTRGVMGAGLARLVKDVYPDAFTAYREHCRLGDAHPGRIFPVRVTPDRVVLNAMTKDDYREPSRMRWVWDILHCFESNWEHYLGVRSAAFPALGCGLGGLSWDEVRPAMETVLGRLPIPIEIYPPRPPNSARMASERRQRIERTQARLTPFLVNP